jgi:hypothetical protein
LASADYLRLRAHNRLVYTADSTEQYETTGVSPISLAEWGWLSQIMTKTPASDTMKELPGYPVQNLGIILGGGGPSAGGE